MKKIKLLFTKSLAVIGTVLLVFFTFQVGSSHSSLGTTPFMDCGNALDFDRVNDFVTTNYEGVLGSNNRTFEAWIFVSASAPSANLAIVDYGRNAAGSRNTFAVTGARGLTFISGGTNANFSSPANTVPVAQWTHVAFVLDNGTGFLYVNGSQVATGNLSNVDTPAGFTPVRVGQRVPGGNILFGGVIDELRIWDVARTEAEIAANLGTEICDPTAEANLELYLPFNEGVAEGDNTGLTTAPDLSTNGNNGTLLNFALDGPTSNWVGGVPCVLMADCSITGGTGCDVVCPPNISVSCEGGTSPAVTGTATAGADCVVAFTDMILGCQTSRTWTATAPTGEISTCVQIITLVDDSAPVVTCPPSMALTCFEGIPSPVTNIADFIAAGGTVSDNCGLNTSIFSQDSNNGGDNCPGNVAVVVRTYFISDACGNVTTCDQTFTYQASTTGPVITEILPSCFKYCADAANPMESDVTFETDCSFGATVTITGPTQIGADNCPGSILRYTYIVTDDCGRSSAPVTRDFIIGNDGPTIECPAFNLLLECGDANNSDYIAAQVGLITANSSCGSDVTINHFPSNFNNITCNTSTVVTFVATDACGRTSSCTTVINISDNIPPVITSVYEDGVCNEAVCGSNLTFWYNEWKDKVLEGLSATDNCDTNVAFSTQGPNSPAQNCPDETTETVVNFVATDNCGNTSFLPYSFFVTALGTPAPQASVSGMIHTEEMDAVEDVEVYLAGGANFFQQFITGNDGMYAFNNVPFEQNYTVTPLHNQFPLNGVSSYDLILIAQHILSVNQLDSPYKMIAADINRSGSITTLDMVELRKMILYINTDFPNNTSWRFVDADFVFPNVENPFATVFPEIVSINGLVESVQHDFVGVKTGDVNGSAIANDLVAADDRSAVGDLVFNTTDQQLKAGERYDVTFSADNFDAINGYQFTLNFDQSALDFTAVNAGDLVNMSEKNFGLSLLNEGVITTSWTDNAAQSVSKEANVFTVSFIAKADVLLSEVLSVGSRYTRAEAYNSDLSLMDVQLRFEGAEKVATADFRLYQNTPNPFKQETVIGFDLPTAGTAILTFYDASGRLLKQVDGDFAKGYNSIPLSRDGLTSGLIYYQLVTDEGTATKKMILQ